MSPDKPFTMKILKVMKEGQTAKPGPWELAEIRCEFL